MNRAWAAAVAAGAVLSTGAARAEISIGAGFESFDWKETTTPSVKENGLRWALDLTWSQSKMPGLSAGYHLKLYNGNVDYDGAALFTGAPLSGDTHYRGLVNEVQAWYRTPNNVDFVLAAGWDHWTRKLNSAQEEKWDVLYAKLGASFNAAVAQGIFGSLGIKYPVYVRENGNLESIGALTNPRLRPDGKFSLYGRLGYRVNPNWDVYAYYDSFRFKQSNAVSVPLSSGGTGVVFQPESKMDVLGMKVQYNFQ